MVMIFVGLLAIGAAPRIIQFGGFQSFWISLPFSIATSLATTALFFTAITIDSLRAVWLGIGAPIVIETIHRFLDAENAEFASQFAHEDFLSNVLWDTLIHSSIVWGLIALAGVAAARWWMPRVDNRIDGPFEPRIELPSDRALVATLGVFLALELLSVAVDDWHFLHYPAGIFFDVAGFGVMIALFTAIFAIPRVWVLVLPLVTIAVGDIAGVIDQHCSGSALPRCVKDAFVFQVGHVLVFMTAFVAIAAAAGWWSREPSNTTPVFPEGGGDSIVADPVPS